MTNAFSEHEIQFDVMTPLGFRVHVSRSYWELIVNVKHPMMAKREADVRACLQQPDQVRQSRTDNLVYLFYKLEHERRWICAVAKQLDGAGFLTTTYLTDAIKEGTHIWPT